MAVNIFFRGRERYVRVFCDEMAPQQGVSCYLSLHIARLVRIGLLNAEPRQLLQS